MATLTIEGGDLVVRLSTLEKLGAFAGDVRVPLSLVRAARMTEAPYSELRGIRVGTGIPFVIVLGRMYYSGGKDFVAVYGKGSTAIIELDAAHPYRRLLVSGVDPQTVVEIAQRAEG